MPVYNESEGITAVVESWIAALDRLGITSELLLYNDGSKDDTGARLDALAGRYPQVRAVHHANRGHGPTILRGYREARGEWIFQTDSDDEIPASAFAALWQRREGQDGVFGIRTGRPSGPGRRLLTAGAASAVRLLFGRGPRDVNVPFRLMRREPLQRLIPRIAADTFAPNVVLSGLFARDGLRFTEVPVPAVARRLGQTTIIGLKTLKLGVKAARQTLGASFADRRRGGRS
jgi:dolichol-phosphate mannosyltransferase